MFASADIAIDAGGFETFRERGTQEEVIDAEARVAREGIAEIFPERVDTLAGVRLAERIGPALRDETAVGLAHLRPEEGVIDPPLRRIHVEIGRHDVVVPDERNRHAGSEKRLGMFVKSFEPAQFVVELRPGCGITVGEIDAPNDDAVDRRLDVAAMRVVGIAGECAPAFDGYDAAREDRDAETIRTRHFLQVP